MNDELSQKLKYQFQQPKLLKIALTHRSRGDDNNERLEFLGDSVVNFVVAELLYHRFPTASEGELSRWRATLVNRDALAEMGKAFELGQYMFLGQGELKSGGPDRPSILSCAMEAIVGAIYLDGGFEAARGRLLEWYAPLLQSLSSAASHKDPKTVLQEYLQSLRKELAIYTVEETTGQAHQQLFVISCYVKDLEVKTLGKGTSRRRAEQDAAQAMLEVLIK